MMDRIDDFICDSNDKSMVPNGLYIANPIERGFRVVSFLLLEFKTYIFCTRKGGRAFGRL